MTVENAKVYREVFEVLKLFPNSFIRKVPKEKILYVYEHMDHEMSFSISKEEFDPTCLSEETIAILTMLFRDYWATEEERKALLLAMKKNEEKEKSKQALRNRLCRTIKAESVR